MLSVLFFVENNKLHVMFSQYLKPTVLSNTFRSIASNSGHKWIFYAFCLNRQNRSAGWSSLYCFHNSAFSHRITNQSNVPASAASARRYAIPVGNQTISEHPIHSGNHYDELPGSFLWLVAPMHLSRASGRMLVCVQQGLSFHSISFIGHAFFVPGRWHS